MWRSRHFVDSGIPTHPAQASTYSVPLLPVAPQGWLATLLRYEYRRVLMLALGLPVLAQAAGMSAVIMYSVEVR